MEESNPNSSSASSNAGPLVQVTFQKDPNRKKKYLESEPKALGCTQIVLAFFLVNAGLLNWSPGWSTMEIINGIFVIIAGSVAIAAQNLSLHTLRACLGLQVFTSITCGVTFLCMLGLSVHVHSYEDCRYLTHDEVNRAVHEACTMLLQVEDHYSAEIKVVMATILGISITLATYCCKVIQCCSPAGFMPVITVNAPPAPEVRREDREGESPSDG
ncbi:hypothetical protein AALO_G00299080 [Alosa alosa]|uniref:Uncharacterized protein n=1 Tax=Alosa alosa TaxID=278164 RepID=A0AAV6FIX0_9TELE|nr:uncharacterized protein LOC125289374 isoform X1 [Alosa alosa]KAG5261020.1 hypothetical protein AALO_G00299080 [Alosa alosa]